MYINAESILQLTRALDKICEEQGFKSNLYDLESPHYKELWESSFSTYAQLLADGTRADQVRLLNFIWGYWDSTA